jgi:NTP pyrophosphatase (non-canonical NTP hydrolase)
MTTRTTFPTAEPITFPTPTATTTIETAVQATADACYDAAHENGWHKDYPLRDNYGSENIYQKAVTNWVVAKLALVMAEAVEGIEEVRNGEVLHLTYYTEETGARHSQQVYVDGIPQYKPEGLPSEMADIIIRTGDLSGILGIDLGTAVAEKLAYNATRGQMHGGKRL